MKSGDFTVSFAFFFKYFFVGCSLLSIFGGKNVYQINNLQRVGLKGSSQMKKALEYLVSNDYIYKNSIYRFSDVMFKKWIRQLTLK